MTEAVHTSSTFPQKLHDIICDPSNNNIIRWVNDGAAFKIVDIAGFESEIVPKHFRRKFLLSASD